MLPLQTSLVLMLRRIWYGPGVSCYAIAGTDLVYHGTDLGSQSQRLVQPPHAGTVPAMALRVPAKLLRISASLLPAVQD